MGVLSECISSTATISKEKCAAALNALKKGIGELNFMQPVSIEMCSSLGEALFKLQFEFEEEDGCLSEIQFRGGKRDLSDSVFSILAPYIDHGSKIVMSHDGEYEIIKFINGEYCVGDEEDEHGEEDEISDAYDNFFSKIYKLDIDEKTIEKIIKKEGSINFTDHSKRSVLMVLFEANERQSEHIDDADERGLNSKSAEILDLLLKHGIDLSIVDEDGYTALTYAISLHLWDAVYKLIAAGADPFQAGAKNLFEFAARMADDKLLSFLLENGGDFGKNAPNSLVAACGAHSSCENKAEFVKRLVEDLGAEVNAHAETKLYLRGGELKKGATPLMAAAMTDDLEVILYLIQHGADISATDAAGNTALHYCSGQLWARGDGSICWKPGKNNLDVVEILATNTDLIGLKNSAGNSPYLLARKDNRKALPIYTRLLREAGKTVPVELSDELNGDVKLAATDGIGYSLIFKDGNLEGNQIFISKSGATVAEIEYREGLPHGSYTVWHENGTPRLRASLEAGKWVGQVKCVSPEGVVTQELNYKDGRRHGRQCINDENGEPLVEAHYKNGEKHGHFYCRMRDGRVVIDENFVDGVPESEEKASDGKTRPRSSTTSMTAMTAHLVAEKLKPSDKLFYHKPEKVLALFEKTQADLI